MALSQLRIPLTGPATCVVCGDPVAVALTVTEESALYADDQHVRFGPVRAEYQHECPGPKGST